MKITYANVRCQDWDKLFKGVETKTHRYFFNLCGPAYRLPDPFFISVLIGWDKHFNLIRITKLPGEGPRLSRLSLKKSWWLGVLRVSVLLCHFVMLVEHARILCGFLARLQWISETWLSPCLLPFLPRAAVCVLDLSEVCSLLAYEMVQPKPVQSKLAWV